MLRAEIRLLPFGEEEEVRTLQTLTIANIGGDRQHGDYHAVLVDHDTGLTRGTQIKGWRRLEHDAADLVREVLTRLSPGRPEGEPGTLPPGNYLVVPALTQAQKGTPGPGCDPCGPTGLEDREGV